jgi:fatty acid desaturase
MTIDGFDIFAFIVFAVLFGTSVLLIVLLGSLPGKIARKRGHPQAQAVNAAAWISLITLGAFWPIAFVWAFVPLPSCGSTSKGGPQA